MRYIAVLVALLFAAGCTSTGDGAKNLIQTLEWEDGECGEFKLTGNVSIGPPVPGFGTDVHVSLEKSKPCGESTSVWRSEISSSPDNRSRNLLGAEDGATTGNGE